MRAKALTTALLWDFIRNPMILSPALIVPVMAWVMTAMVNGEPEGMAVAAPVLLVMPAYFLGWMTPAFSLAEAKEKRSLEAMLITPLRSWEYIGVQAGVSVVLSLAAGAVVTLIMGQPPASPVLFSLAYLLLTLFTVAGGLIMGLLLPDSRSLGSAGTPVMLALIFSTTLPWALFLPVVWEVQAFLPTRPAVELLMAGYAGQEAPILKDSLIMLAYTALLVYFCVRRLRRLAFAPR